MANHLLAIGINYTGTNNALRGCINDARDWAAFFQPVCDSVTPLHEQLATKANIVAEVAKVLGRLTANDTAIITFSGHGTHIPDKSGDEADRRDEALCPWDMNRKLLLDDELYDLLRQRADFSRVLLITDCCHSGTMTRNTEDRGAARYVPFAELTCCMCSDAVDRITSQAKAAHSFARATDSGLIHLSGCQDDQVSYDATIAGKACGAFTHYALAALKARKTPGMTYGEWKEAVRPYLPSNRYPQSPGFSGDMAAVVPGFEVATAAPAPSAVGTLTLGGKVYEVRERN